MPLIAPAQIESPRLLLRMVQEQDIADLLEVNGDEQVTRHLPYATWTSMADGHAWLERMAGLQAIGTALQLVVLEREHGKAIGTCLLLRYEERSEMVELGYVLGRAHWGRGLMHEALGALLAQAFGAMGLRRVEAQINPSNGASVRLIERLGFTKEGLLRQRWLKDGQPYDVAWYGLLRDEYRVKI